MSIFQNGALHLFVHNVASGLSDTNTLVPDALPLGSAVLVKTDDKTVEWGAVAANTEYQVVARALDGTIRRSPAFTTADILSKTTQTYTLSTEQVKFFGYDGSAVVGFGTPVTGSTYSLAFWLKHTANTLNNTPEVKTVHYIATGTTQSAMAKGFQDSFLRTFSTMREPNKVILCDRVALTTSVAAGDTYNMALFTNGSKSVTLWTKDTAATAAVTASSTTVASGVVINVPSYNGRSFTFTATADDHVIYIGGTSYYVADAGTAQQNADAIVVAINAGTQASASDAAGASTTVTIVYKEGQYYLPPVVFSNPDAAPATVAVTIATGDAIPVKYKTSAATTGAYMTLDNPWQGPTGYTYNGTTEATHSGEATLTSDTWGLKFTGVAQPFNAVTDEVNKVSFDIQSSDFGTLVEYESVKPTLGSGTFQQVSYLEKFAQWGDKGVVVSAYPPTVYASETNSAYGYNLYTVVCNKKPYTSSTTGVTPSNLFTIIIALKATHGLSTLATSDPWGTVLA